LHLPVRLPNGKSLSIQVKKSKRAKHLRLKANIFGIQVVVPMIYYEIEVMKFLNLKKDWILQTYEYYQRLRNEYGEENLKLNTIAFLGKRYNLKITKDVVGIENPPTEIGIDRPIPLTMPVVIASLSPKALPIAITVSVSWLLFVRQNSLLV
jgi:predicted metal-dependent hydrolase